MQLNEQSHTNCFIDTISWQRWQWSLLVYKNEENVIKGSYRAYLKDKNMFVHCVGETFARRYNK